MNSTLLGWTSTLTFSVPVESSQSLYRDIEETRETLLHRHDGLAQHLDRQDELEDVFRRFEGTARDVFDFVDSNRGFITSIKKDSNTLEEGKVSFLLSIIFGVPFSLSRRLMID
jgi:hypothetical protein